MSPEAQDVDVCTKQISGLVIEGLEAEDETFRHTRHGVKTETSPPLSPFTSGHQNYYTLSERVDL